MCKINGKKLVELRTVAGISQSQLAKKTGVSPSSINKYEKGVTNPSDEVVNKICLVLNIKKDDIEIHDVGYNFLSRASKTVEKIRKKKGFVRYSTPEETEKYINNTRTLSKDEERELIKTELSSAFGIGSKKYILADPKWIHIPEWQRDTDMAKATEIAENFNDEKYDPVKAYLYDGLLYVADGAHRIIAFIIDKKLKILVEVLGCNEHEAILTFLDQQSGRKSMTINDMYRAGVKANIKEYLHFKELFENYNIQITAEKNKLDNPIGEIKPSSTILRMVENDREMLEKTINLIQKLEWSGSSKNAFILRNFSVLKRMYANFGEDVEEKLLKHCKGATFYESKVLPIKSNAELYDMLSESISSI